MGGNSNHKDYTVLTLPTEIVVEIFESFLPDYPLCPPLLGLESPTVLTQICREWREIALAAPTLWRAISVCLNGGVSSSAEKQLAVVQNWLLRSRPLPISLCCITTANSFLAAIIPHRDRWEHLYMRTVPPNNIFALNGPMPLLRHLDMTRAATPGSVVLNAPLLYSAVLDYGAAQAVVLPYAQLTTLCLTGAYLPNESVPLLQRTPNLVHCELAVFSYADDHAAPDVTLPRLESLTLRIRSLDGHPRERFLNVPALRRLHIVESHSVPAAAAIRSLGAFLEKAGCARLEEVQIMKPKLLAEDASDPEHEVASEAAYRTTFPHIPAFILVYSSARQDDKFNFIAGVRSRVGVRSRSSNNQGNRVLAFA
ncbi:hypothetical protein C8F04DRAFT_1030880 [Mycena alexandri]|uniref:F-box domain-containing protein n=1 Tax=Mycena alexandri TaxID=1745969 RepID=A0AAD6TAE3_9AGAR|nr:hypothetical protein C8F04DRAFT_1030880 [Mycena alexandri]